MENNRSGRIRCSSCWRSLGEHSVYELFCLHFGIEVDSPYDFFPRGRRPKGKSERMEGLFLLRLRRHPDGESDVLILVMPSELPATEDRNVQAHDYHGVAVFCGIRNAIVSRDEEGAGPSSLFPFSETGPSCCKKGACVRTQRICRDTRSRPAFRDRNRARFRLPGARSKGPRCRRKIDLVFGKVQRKLLMTARKRHQTEV
jgi:hypothetical protein